MDQWVTGLLLLTAGAAGWVDAVVGGGGLLLLPALMLAAPGVPAATLLGTNKFTAITGTTTAAVTYARRTKLDWRIAGPAAGLAVLTAGCGAVLATRVPASAFRPAILVVLVGVALFLTFRPDVGIRAEPEKRTPRRVMVAVVAAGGVIACYDGLIGPGTGTFLIVMLATVTGVDFLHASAMAKLVNAGTNLGALTVFALGGHVWWLLGAGMAVCNVLGAAVGARVALRRGSGFVRVVLLVVVVALVVRVGYDVLRH